MDRQRRLDSRLLVLNRSPLLGFALLVTVAGCAGTDTRYFDRRPDIAMLSEPVCVTILSHQNTLSGPNRFF